MKDEELSFDFEQRGFAQFRHELTVNVPKDADLKNMEAAAQAACEKMVQHVFRCLVVGRSATVSVMLRKQRTNHHPPTRVGPVVCGDPKGSLEHALKVLAEYLRRIDQHYRIAKQVGASPTELSKFLHGKRPLPKHVVEMLLAMVEQSPDGVNPEWQTACSILKITDWPKDGFKRRATTKKP
ncbi:MAG: hypothetical protein WC813_04785 [Patescibacteria group bacterium]|jgi:hypothetical protein